MLLLDVSPNVDFCVSAAQLGHKGLNFWKLGRCCHMRILLFSLLAHGHGWWGNSSREEEGPALGPWRVWLHEAFPTTADHLTQAEQRAETVRQYFVETEYPPWSHGIWWAIDALVSLLGWTIFGAAWGDVRNGCRRLVQLGGILFLCLAAHYMWAVCYPVVTVFVGLLMAILWLLRRFLRTFGTITFYVQQWLGGAPEVDDVEMWGPATGSPPETSHLRQFKPPGSGERWVAVRKGGLRAVFRLGSEGQTIRSHGLYVQATLPW